ncbi:MAG: ATP-binding protein [Oligoflexales bacterium]
MIDEQSLNLTEAAKLHRVMILPIVVMVLTINVVFVGLWYFERQNEEDALENHIVTTLKGHSIYLSREIFFDRAAAVTDRLSEIVRTKAWNPDGLPARLCLHLVFDPTFNRRQPESVCSDGAAGENVHGESLAASRFINLVVGDKPAARLFYDLTLKSNLGSLIPPKLLWSVGLGILAAIIAYLMLFRRLNANLIQPAHRRIVKAEKIAGIAQFMQTVAHDIRSPLSLMRTVIRNLNESDIKPEAKADLLNVADRELGQINNMLADIMAIGPIIPKNEPVSPISLIANALIQSSLLHERRGIMFSYNLKHTKQIAVEEPKVARVFGNIIDNAMQAVNDKGTISVTTRPDTLGRYVEFCIKNTGSHIATDDCDKIFEAFFTKGKSGGTGLGLASAKSIIEAYGGKIWCESNARNETAFFFTFPTHDLAEHQTTALLPQSSDAVASRRTSQRTLNSSVITVPLRPLQILLVDDEPAYTQSLALAIGSYPSLSNIVQISTATSVMEATRMAESLSLDLIITDMDFGHGQPDGFHLLRELRYRFPGLMIAACTNRTGDNFKTSVLDAGANTYMTKPANKAILAQVLNQTIAKVNGNGSATPQVIFVDDELIYYKDWSKRFKDITFHYFNCPEHLWTRIEKDPTFLDRIDAILTDFKFSSESTENGSDVARRLRSLCTKPIYLVSCYREDELGERLERGLFAEVLSKDDLPDEGEFRRKIGKNV